MFEGRSYRGSSGITPHFEPALAPASHEDSAQPEDPQGSYGLTHSGRASSEYPKPAAPSVGHFSGHGGPVDGYSPEGSVSSYGPGLLMRQKPRQNPQDPRYQPNTNVNGVLQTKAGMWDISVPKEGVAPRSFGPMASMDHRRWQQQPVYYRHP